MPKPLKLQKGEIWKVNLGDVVEHEQSGERPAVIITNISQTNQAVVVPLTSTPEREFLAYTCKIGATKENGLDCDSIALVFQMRSISKQRLIEKIGDLCKEDSTKVDNEMRVLLGL